MLPFLGLNVHPPHTAEGGRTQEATPADLEGPAKSLQNRMVPAGMVLSRKPAATSLCNADAFIFLGFKTEPVVVVHSCRFEPPLDIRLLS